MNVTITVELTPWRESTPPGMWLRDWSPIHSLLPRPDTSGEHAIRGAAAVVRDEGRPVRTADGEVVHHRYAWRIWTPIGTTWPYRGGSASSVKAAQ
jgi:hypothetical protein